MRDIKPQQPNRKKLPPRKPPGELPPEVQQLYQKRHSSQKKSLGKPIDHLTGPPVEGSLKPPSSSEAPLPPNVPVPKQPKRPRFAGSKVDVAQVQVPKDAHSSDSPPTVSPPDLKKSAVRVADRAELEDFKRKLKEKRGERAQRKESQSAAPVMPVKKKPGGRPRLAHKERSAALILLALVILAGALAAIVFLPKAEVVLTLETAPLLVDQKLLLSSSGQIADNTLSATAFQEEILLDGTAPVQSREVVGSKATGTVSIVNRTVDEQKIVEQSRLVTDDGVLFYMQKHAIVPPNSSVAVPVEAAEAGEESNTASGKLNFAALDASAQSLVYAEVTQPITGGSGDEVAVVKDADVARAKEAAGEMARQQIEQKIRGELQEGWTILDESWDMEVSDFTTPAGVNEQLEAIPYAAAVTVRVLGYQQAELEGKLQQILEGRLDENHMLFPGPIAFAKSVDDVNWEKGEGQMTVRVTHSTIPTFSLDTLRDKIAGRKKAEAQAYLEGLPGVQSVSIDLAPFWVKSIPRIDQRVELDLESDR